MLDFLESTARGQYESEMVEARDELLTKLAHDGFDLSLLRTPSSESREVWETLKEAKEKRAAVEEEGRYNARSDVRHTTHPKGQALLGDAADMLVSGKLGQAVPSDLDKTAGAGDQFLKGLFRNVAKRGAPKNWGTGIRNTFSAPTKGTAAAKAGKKLTDAEKFGRMVGNVAVPGAAAWAGKEVLSSADLEQLRNKSRAKLAEAGMTKSKEAGRLTTATKLMRRTAKENQLAEIGRLQHELLLRKATNAKTRKSTLAKFRGKPYRQAVDEEASSALRAFQAGEHGSVHRLNAALQERANAEKAIKKVRAKALGGTTAAGGAGALVYNEHSKK